MCDSGKDLFILFRNMTISKFLIQVVKPLVYLKYEWIAPKLYAVRAALVLGKGSGFQGGTELVNGTLTNRVQMFINRPEI